MKAMILAAGRGERLGRLTDETPKALAEVNGQSLLERNLERLHVAGINDVVINLGWLGEQIKARVGSGSAYGLNVVYSDERDNILETGGGIHKALPLLGDDPFLITNADIHTDMPVPDVSLTAADLGHLVLVPTPDYKGGGDFDLADGYVRNAKSPTLTYSGVAIYRPEFFGACTPGRFSVVPMLVQAADAGHLRGSIYEGLWADVGTPQRLRAAQC